MAIFWRSPILSLLLFLFITRSTTVTSFPSRESLILPLPNHILHQFPNPTWIENLSMRSNGGLLVTLLTTPDLYLIDPSQPGNPILVYSFPSVSGIRGIAELENDVFYVAAGNVSLKTFVNTPRTASVWEVDMRSFSLSSGALVRKVTDILEAGFLKSAIALSHRTVLIADSALGLVWEVNVDTGTYFSAISDPAMATVPTARLQIGINGIKIRDGYLYFTNTNQGTFSRVPISSSVKATGAVEVLAKGLTPDDFVLDNDGRAYIAQIASNVVSLLLGNGTVIDVVGSIDQLTVAGVTACDFGRDRGNHPPKSHILYCTTTGALASPVNGTVTEGGKVVVIDTEYCS